MSLARLCHLAALAACALLAAIAWPAWAHKSSDAYLTLELHPPGPAEPVVTQRLDVALRDLDRELQLDADGDGQLTWGEVRTRWADIQALAEVAVELRLGGRRCRPVGDRPPAQLDEHSDGRYAVLVQRLACDGAVGGRGDAAAAGSGPTLDYRLFARTDPTHRGIARWVAAGQTLQTTVLVPGAGPQAVGPAGTFEPLDEHASTSRAVGFAGFVAEGMHHILIGVDHLLFLLALLLPSVLVVQRAPEASSADTSASALRPVLLEVAGVVTAFTLAHSVTLALAAFDVLDPPARWVESLIAATVVLAALNNLHPVVRRGRWAITFAFGLVHGFGFASVLKDLGLGTPGEPASLLWPLLGFNLGVELGQLAFVALFVPLAWTLRPHPGNRSGALRWGSAAIAVLALVWLAERALDVELLALV